MKLQFDPNQQYQLNAVAAMTDLFEGQPQGAPEYSVVHVGGMVASLQDRPVPNWELETGYFWRKRDYFLPRQPAETVGKDPTAWFKFA